MAALPYEPGDGLLYDQMVAFFCRVLTLCLAALAIAASGVPVSTQTSPTTYEMVLPSLNPDLPASAEENLPLLYQRLLMAFAGDYGTYLMDHQNRDLADGMTVYYLRQELQALTDMWRATGKDIYLDLAADLSLRAIQAAIDNRRPLLDHGESRGDWPCFYLESVQAQTGGHSQLCDFQGCAGFLNVACILQQLNRPEWEPITDFVEHQVVEKWLYYKPSITTCGHEGRPQLRQEPPRDPQWRLATSASISPASAWTFIAWDVATIAYDDMGQPADRSVPDAAIRSESGRSLP